MSQQLNSSRLRACARRLSGYITVLAVLLLILVAPNAHAQPTACNIVYAITPQNTSAFGATVNIENTGTTAITSWSLTWAFANGQTVSSLWNGIETQSGANVTVTNESYNGSIAAGATYVGVGFNGTWNGTTNAIPTAFSLSGTACSVNGVAPGGSGSFTLKPSAATLSIAQSASGTDTITVTDVSPFSGSVTLAASGLPSGVTAAVGTNPPTPTSGLAFTASATATAGTSTVTITGTSGSLSATTTISLTVTTSGGTGMKCTVDYVISPQNSSAFGAAITIDNTGTTAWTSWTLTWTFANGQTVSSLWNGMETQSGANVTVKNESYNGSIAAGGSLSGIGFNGTWNGTTNAIPTAFSINGTACTVN